MKEILITYQTLLSALIGAGISFFIFWIKNKKSDDKNKYERRLWIYKALLSNSAQIVCFEFVSAFNMILVEFEKDKDVLEARNNFFKTVCYKASKEDTEEIIRERNIQQQDALIRLINIIGTKINIKVDQLDIQNRIYWPQGFNDTAIKQRELVDLLIKTLSVQEKIYKLLIDKKLSIGVYQGSPIKGTDNETKK